MSGRGYDSLVRVMLIFLFIALFAMQAQSGRLPWQLKARSISKNSSAGNNLTVVDSTALAENKFVLVFCKKTKCYPHWSDCYCCLNSKPPEMCYDTRDQCNAICPICNPKCPPQSSHQSLIEGQLSYVANGQYLT
ncbi:hypothetical protein EJB05_03803 [Eragrostis curvula]|uniref:Embryo surrounding factor 1 brassicaceae domain-containing protein n=1 Tax=Eragrostis curvula TaxID=38414 RepID=A0A5J9W8P6_9POAL|nr:hypothetical protein EJB05_03803 [Eragrostis curvula]